jgi:hypothetical protein
MLEALSRHKERVNHLSREARADCASIIIMVIITGDDYVGSH